MWYQVHTAEYDIYHTATQHTARLIPPSDHFFESAAAQQVQQQYSSIEYIL